MSRKLDRAIAEALGRKQADNPNDTISYGLWQNPTGDWEQFCPSYSTDGNAMLELIEEMQKSNHFVAMDTREYTASFYNIDKADWVGTSKGKTLPEAVAKAAYRALTGEEWRTAE